MATAYREANGSPVSIGRIFQQAFGVLGRNPIATFGIAFLLGAVPQVALGYLLAGVQAEVRQFGGVRGVIALSLLSLLISTVLAFVVQGGIVRATVAYRDQRVAGFGECLATGLRALLPLVGLAIVSSIAVGFASLLFLVPGIMLLVVWWVAAPVLVEERLGVFAALGRSAALTRGARWKVFGLLLIALVLYLLVSAAIGAVTLAVFGFRGLTSAGGTPGLGLTLFNLAFQTVLLAFGGTIQTSSYVELRQWQEGPRTAELSDIFA